MKVLYFCNTMPTLEKITISDYRNIEMQEICFSPNVNCIWGDNGEGKTNLLDAIYYLSMTKSAMSPGDRYNFRHGCSCFAICGQFRMPNGLSKRISVEVDADGKKIRHDEKICRTLDHIGQLPVVMVSPSDISLVSESSEERRKFLNGVLSQLDRSYLESLQQYNRLLAQRNRLLKEERIDGALLKVLDERMAACAAPVYKARKEFAARLEDAVGRLYRDISGGTEEVGIAYSSDLDDGTLDEILCRRMDRDLAQHFTTAGIQRDELIFNLDGHPIRRCGSQGQQKSFLVALKFAQYEIMKAAYDFAPTLLLDDIFDKLDRGRISNLLKMVSGQDFGQIFITDCNKTRIMETIDAITAERSYFETHGGCFSEGGRKDMSETEG